MTSQRIVVVGAGGFAREVVYLIQEIDRASPGTMEFVKFLVPDPSTPGPYDSPTHVVGEDWLVQNRDRFDGFAMGMGAPKVKLRLFAELRERFPDKSFPALVHPNARFDRASATIEEGVVITDGVIGTVGIRFERLSMVNLCCTIGHETVVGAASTLNPTANISGGVVLGEGVLVGTGSQILQYITVGAHATVGAGACVTKDVAPGVTVLGVPAKPRLSAS